MSDQARALQAIRPWDGFFELELHTEDRRIVTWLESNRSLII